MKKQKQSLPIWCNRDTFQLPLHYCLAVSEAEYLRVTTDLKIPANNIEPWIKNWHANATTHFFENRSMGKSCAVVCINMENAPSWVQLAGLIVHEATHIWQEAKSLIGEPNPSPEFDAYSMQSIAQNLLDAMDTKFPMFNKEKPNASASRPRSKKSAASNH